MPKIDDIKNKKQKVFKKVSYRPWDTDLEENKYSEPQANETLLEEKKGEVSYANKNTQICGLYGLQKNILIFLVKNMRIEDDSYCYTHNISYKLIMNSINCSKACISPSLSRLKAKGFIYPVTNKTGRGGFASYKIPKDIYIGLREEFPEDFSN